MLIIIVLSKNVPILELNVIRLENVYELIKCSKTIAFVYAHPMAKIFLRINCVTIYISPGNRRKLKRNKLRILLIIKKNLKK